jgi:hypothetical protein
MAGRKVWLADEVLTAEDLNDYLMDQSVVVFASAGARTSAVLSPEVGMLTYRVDGSVYELWNGSAWVAAGNNIGTVPNATYALTSGTAVFASSATNATNATTAANATKVSNQTVFIQSSTPTATATNDLWFW